MTKLVKYIGEKIGALMPDFNNNSIEAEISLCKSDENIAKATEIVYDKVRDYVAENFSESSDTSDTIDFGGINSLLNAYRRLYW